MSPLSAEARNLNRLLNNFATTTSGVGHAMIASADGLPIAISEGLDRAAADQLAAIAFGLVSLALSAARSFDAGRLRQAVVTMERGLLLIMVISDGSYLITVAAPSCEMGLVGGGMALLVTRVGDALTPSLRAELHAALPP